MTRSTLSGIWAATAVCVIATTVPAMAQVKVVVTSKPIHALVSGVMTGIGTPQLLVGGNSSPHTYALKPSDAKALNGADVVFRVSEELEPFTAKVFKSLPKTVVAISLGEAPGLSLLAKRAGGPFEAHTHAKGHGHDHAAAKKKDDAPTNDPHVWLDPANAKAMVLEIANRLGAVSPKDAATFKTNAANLNARIDDLSAELERDLKPIGPKPFVVLHDSLQYLESRFGLSAVGAITVSPEEQPSAKRLTDLRKKVSGLGAICVFSEPQFPAKLVNSVTEGSKAKTAVVDPEGGLLTPGPELYFELMRKAAAALKGCLS